MNASILDELVELAEQSEKSGFDSFGNLNLEIHLSYADLLHHSNSICRHLEGNHAFVETKDYKPGYAMHLLGFDMQKDRLIARFDRTTYSLAAPKDCRISYHRQNNIAEGIIMVFYSQNDEYLRLELDSILDKDRVKMLGELVNSRP